MEKIKMTTPLVEMDGDEMTRILWKMIKDELILPYVDLKTEYYDLGLEYRNSILGSIYKFYLAGSRNYHLCIFVYIAISMSCNRDRLFPVEIWCGGKMCYHYSECGAYE